MEENNKRIFICNKCKSQKNPNIKCVKCNSWNLTPLGIGTETVYEEIKNNLEVEPPLRGSTSKLNKIFLLDKKNAKTTSQINKIIKGFEESDSSILIGTELAFFHLTNKVPLSIIVSLNSLLSIPNFRTNEKIIKIILSIISKTKEKIIIQRSDLKNSKRSDIGTNSLTPDITPEDFIINAIISKNLFKFIQTELGERKKFNYPPYKTLIKITHAGNHGEKKESEIFLKEFLNYELNATKKYEIEIYDGFTPKINNKYITNALIKVKNEEWPNEDLLKKILSLPQNFSINLNPEDLS